MVFLSYQGALGTGTASHEGWAVHPTITTYGLMERSNIRKKCGT